MARLLVMLAFVIALAAAALAALIVAPAPTKTLALLAIVAGEKSFVLIAAALAAAVLALIAFRPGARLLATLTVLIAVGTIVVALGPPAQAMRLASQLGLDLDVMRYLRAPLDSEEQGAPKKTVTYATVDGKPLALDVYVGAAAASGSTPTRPVIIVHGGGWSKGDKGDAALFSQWLADQGCTVFDIQYRIAPQPNGKTATGDVKCAVAWVKSHARDPDWTIDPGKVTLFGRSAGGHLALLAAYTAGEPDLPPSCEGPGAETPPVPPVDTTVDAVIALYAPTDLLWGYGKPGNPGVYDGQDRLRQFVGGAPETTGDQFKRLSPTDRVTSRAPRTLLIQGGRDQFVSPLHVDRLEEKLRAADVRYETLLIPYAQHSFDFVFGGLSGQLVESSIGKFLGFRRQ